MHDEDNAIGLSVKDPGGESWTLYGDKCVLDSVNDDNKERCVNAVQASADEVYKAYQTKQAPLPADYRAWTYAATLESANAHQTLAGLFTFKNERRREIKNRKLWNFNTDWQAWSTALECKTSGWWNYPITIDGVLSIIPRSSVAVTTPGLLDVHVFYQSPDGGIVESGRVGGVWGGKPIGFKAMLFTPLAAINLGAGKEVSIPNRCSARKSVDGGINRFVSTTSTSSTTFRNAVTRPIRDVGSLASWVT
jgi:hypothetical protein